MFTKARHLILETEWHEQKKNTHHLDIVFVLNISSVINDFSMHLYNTC